MLARLTLMGVLLSLIGCTQLGAELTIAGASYVASLNNLGAQTLRFIDDKRDQTCPPPAKPQE
jgi:hypothetical protein